MITPHDEASLERYFCAANGLSSNLGEQLERASVMAIDDPECKKCQGTGFAESAESTLRRYDDGEEAVSEVCEACGGSGCRGRIRGRRANGNAYMGEKPWEDTEHQALVSRRVRLLSAKSQAVLENYYGPTGCRWADVHDRGRLFALLPLTIAGAELARSSYEGLNPKKTYPPAEVLHVEAELAKVSSQSRRLRLLPEAWLEARALFEAASLEWLGVRGMSQSANDVDLRMGRLLRLVV